MKRLQAAAEKQRPTNAAEKNSCESHSAKAANKAATNGSLQR